MLRRLIAWWRGTRTERRPIGEPVTPPAEKKGMRVRHEVAAAASAPASEAVQPFTPYKPAPGVVPSAMAMDDANFGALQSFAMSDAYSEGLAFMGYPALSQLAQRAEYRRPAETLALEMTRKWIKVQSTGDEEEGDETKAEKIRQIEAELDRIGAREAFKRAVELDGFFGRSHIALTFGDEDDDEKKTPLSESAAKIQKGAKLKPLQVIEPIWTYPGDYNSTDPMRPDFYKPDSWFVLGTKVHASRLLTFVFRPVPDMLKPAYAFGGLSMSQMAKPYVDNWLRTRQSVSDLLHSFSVSGIKTNMASVLDGGAADGFFARMDLFNRSRDNRGLMVLDKDTEEFFQFNAPLSGLDKLQAQSQEHLSAVSGIPLVKLLGITPSGLNASSEGEIRTFYDWVESQQEAHFRRALLKVINIVQLSLFGEIDPEITHVYEPLWSLDAVQVAGVRKTEADTDAVLIDKGVIDPHEARVRVAKQKDSAYASLDTSIIPEPPEPEPTGFGGDPTAALPGGPSGTPAAPDTPQKGSPAEGAPAR